MILNLEIIGSLLLLLAFFHIPFPKKFEWKKELASLSLLNRQMLYVHTFFIALVVFLMGLFCLVSAKEIVETTIGRRVALGFGIFWLARLIIQFFGYSSDLWKGKTFETSIHIIFSIFWFYLSFSFFEIYFSA
ncbi:hypothetical protein BH09BAC5_BH09BAC5_28110 [soil metagenome]